MKQQITNQLHDDSSHELNVLLDDECLMNVFFLEPTRSHFSWINKTSWLLHSFGPAKARMF